MRVAHLSLRDFRSYAEVELPLDAGVTALIGPNGQGKTNLVEAVGYLSTLGSHRVAQDAPLVRLGAERAVVRGQVVRDDRPLLRRGGDHPRQGQPGPGQPVAGAAGPRRCSASCAACCSPPRTWPSSRATRPSAAGSSTTCSCCALPGTPGCGPTTTGCSSNATPCCESPGPAVRAEQVRPAHSRGLGLAPGHRRRRAAGRPDRPGRGAETVGGQGLSGGGRAVVRLGRAGGDRLPVARWATTCRWSPTATCCPPRCSTQISEVRKAELERGITLVGPHRDELVLKLGPLPAKGYASHGESWSFALALKLAAYDLLRAETDAGGEPVLVLDDVFAELDGHRRERLANAGGRGRAGARHRRRPGGRARGAVRGAGRRDGRRGPADPVSERSSDEPTSRSGRRTRSRRPGVPASRSPGRRWPARGPRRGSGGWHPGGRRPRRPATTRPAGAAGGSSPSSAAAPTPTTVTRSCSGPPSAG